MAKPWLLHVDYLNQITEINPMLYNILGFKASEVTAGLGWHDKLAVGFPEKAVWHLARALNVPTAQTAALVGHASSKLSWKSRHTLLDSGMSGTLFSIALAFHRLHAVLKNDAAVIDWLSQPRAELHGQVPLNLLLTSPGAFLAMEAIGRIRPPKTVERNVPVQREAAGDSEDSAESGEAVESGEDADSLLQA